MPVIEDLDSVVLSEGYVSDSDTTDVRFYKQRAINKLMKKGHIEALGATKLADTILMEYAHRILEEDNTKVLKGSQVTARQGFINTLKMRYLDVNVPFFHHNFWVFAHVTGFKSFATRVDLNNDQVITQELMEGLWDQVVKQKYRTWKRTTRLSAEAKAQRLREAREKVSSTQTIFVLIDLCANFSVRSMSLTTNQFKNIGASKRKESGESKELCCISTYVLLLSILPKCLLIFNQ